MINKKTKEQTFCNFYDLDIFTFYSNDYFYITFKDSKIKYLFKDFLIINSKPHSLKINYFKKKPLYFNEKEFLKLFPGCEIVSTYVCFEGIIILSYFKYYGFLFLNVINKGNLTKEKLIKKLKKFDDLLMGFFIYNNNNELIDYLYFYGAMNEIVLNARKEFIFIEFLDFKINKCNHQLKKDRHYIRG